MKKILSLTLAAVLLLGLFGCTVQEQPSESKPAVTETTGVSEITPPTETSAPQTEPPETTLSTDPTEAITSTQSTEATEGTEPTQPQKPKETTGKPEETKPNDPPATEPTQPATESTEPPSTEPAETTPPETQPPETQPPETEPAETEPSPTEPTPTVPVPTEPQPTEPAGCTHNWQCVHHDEEGHWLAGVICDCGWVIYGSPDEVSAAWNAHSVSFPPEESLFEHGGFGCVDEWVVDAPAYEEWYCSLCGEQRP